MSIAKIWTTKKHLLHPSIILQVQVQVQIARHPTCLTIQQVKQQLTL